jgi:hypothetical protein
MGPTRFFELLKTNEIESFRDGRKRQVVIQSLHDYVARHRVGSSLIEPAADDETPPREPAEADPEPAPAAKPIDNTPPKRPAIRRASSPTGVDVA